jgi:tetratricopeptide (TPR) repeat protein
MLPQCRTYGKKLAMARPRLICLVLAFATLLVYLPVRDHGFIGYDDPEYVTDNRIVRAGLTWVGLKWAFTGSHVGNWHPLTWLSHMLDCQLFGVEPGAHHLVNVLFHAANSSLVFLLLFRMTGALWPAAMVAALFAWHPLHVESVAWVAERKDVLSTFFGLLSLLAYVQYASKDARNARSAPREFAFCLLWFALGLLAKPMLVTLPFLFLLLDYWPLKRMNIGGGLSGLNLRILVLEKWPFFLLTIVSCIITFLAQRTEAVVDLEQHPLGARLANAIVAYVLYLVKMVWPADLAIIYPLQRHIPIALVAGSALVLLLLSWYIWRNRIARPYLIVGWLWFLGTLVPVIGLVQVGTQAMADRYSYLPSIGVFMGAVYLARDVTTGFRIKSAHVAACAAVVLVACIVVTERQLTYWRDSIRLFARAISVTRDNDAAHIDMGVALEEQGRKDEALKHYLQALRINPNRAQAHNNVANVLMTLGERDQAIRHYREALKLKRRAPLAHLNLGTALLEAGQFQEALEHLQEAARLAPEDPRPHSAIGKAYLRWGQSAQAMAHFREAMLRDPGDLQIPLFLARVLASDENPNVRSGPEALKLAEGVNRLTGGEQPFVLDTAAMAYAEMGRFQDAESSLSRAIDLTEKSGGTNELSEMRARLRLYQSGRPYRERFSGTPLPTTTK